jgi:hypothetical protein
MKNSQRRILHAPSALALLWAGMLIGVSFLATPAKFLAPSLILPVALDVGRQTFGLFSLVEIVFASILVAAAFVTRHGRGIPIAALAAWCHRVVRACCRRSPFSGVSASCPLTQ